MDPNLGLFNNTVKFAAVSAQALCCVGAARLHRLQWQSLCPPGTTTAPT
jgi:hypothetical protein